jgi:antitoxin MazE
LSQSAGLDKRQATDIHRISEEARSDAHHHRRWGNSTALRLPKAIVDELNLKPGQQVEVRIEGGEARLMPVRAPRLTLEELLAEADRIGWENQPGLENWSELEPPWPPYSETDKK